MITCHYTVYWGIAAYCKVGQFFCFAGVLWNYICNKLFILEIAETYIQRCALCFTVCTMIMSPILAAGCCWYPLFCKYPILKRFCIWDIFLYTLYKSSNFECPRWHDIWRTDICTRFHSCSLSAAFSNPCVSVNTLSLSRADTAVSRSGSPHDASHLPSITILLALNYTSKVRNIAQLNTI